MSKSRLQPILPVAVKVQIQVLEAEIKRLEYMRGDHGLGTEISAAYGEVISKILALILKLKKHEKENKP